MGLSWSLAYIMIIARGRRDRTYGMPLVALAMNLSWEVLYSFVLRSPHKAGRFFHTTWLVLDIGILAQALRYGPDEHEGARPAAFYAQLGASLVASSAVLSWYAKRRSDPMGIYSALSSNVVMSALFLKMLADRRSSRGQSMGIALSKLIGTCSSTVALLLFPRPPYDRRAIVGPLGATVLGLDVAYLVKLAQVSRRDRAPRAPSAQRVTGMRAAAM